jgi:uncharacterized protein (TIGR02300 family)
VTQASLGVKRLCPKCGARFYDLGKNPVSCPKCKHSFDVTAPVKARRSRKSPAEMAELAEAKAKADAKKKAKSLPKEMDDDDINLDGFDDVEVDSDEEIEEMDDIDDIDSLEELDDVDDGKGSVEDESVIEEETTSNALTHDLDQEEEEEEEEEEDTKPKRGAVKPVSKAKPAPKKKK